MLVHLADTDYIRTFIKRGMLKGLKFPILFSFFKTDRVDLYHPYTTSLIVDSGAFTFQKKGVKKISAYFNDYKKCIDKHNHFSHTWFVELDIDNVIGYDKVKEMRKELLEITPKIIPVWHKNRGLNDYKEICRDFDYIGISGVNGDDLFNEKEMRVFVNYAHKHGAKVHGFGVHKDKTLKTVPFDSVDATSWCNGAIYGRYKSQNLSSNYRRNHCHDVAFLQLLQGIKKAKYYEKYWRNKKQCL